MKKLKRTLYVMGDVHGNAKAFDSIMNQIQLKEDERLWILGDVIDRHSHGLYLIQRIMRTPNISMLLGNHEIMMMQALGIPYRGQDIRFGISENDCMEQWYANGGNATHYEWEMDLSKAERAEIAEYLGNLKTSVNLRSAEDKSVVVKLAHSVPIELYDQYGVNNKHGFGAFEWSVWDREVFKNPPELEAPVFFGHTPTPVIENDAFHKPINTDNPSIIMLDNEWVGMDCGAGWSHGGRLACIRVNDMQEFYSE